MTIFVTVSNQTGLDTRSMTRRSIKMENRGGEGDYNASSPPEGGPAD